jgi:hypothetical protein
VFHEPTDGVVVVIEDPLVRRLLDGPFLAPELDDQEDHGHGEHDRLQQGGEGYEIDFGHRITGWAQSPQGPEPAGMRRSGAE